MIRMFETHRVRKQQELEGMWDFSPAAGKDAFPAAYGYRLPVPSCWEQHPELLTYRGIGFYRKTIHVSRACNLRLEFKGVSHTADVYFDGRHAGHHYNAFTPFAVVIPGATQGVHELLVRVDNTFSAESALHIGNDYYTYGGIIRPVAMEEAAEAIIERIEFLPALHGGQWQAAIKAYISNISGARKSFTVKVRLAGAEHELGLIELAAGQSGAVAKEFPCPGVKEWNSKKPELYLLEAGLHETGTAEPMDDLIERVGFRTVQVKGRDILLNGSPLKLAGFNRHEDFGIVGCAIPVQLMAKDLDLIMETGANSVRTSHYPNDERFLDLCDERGILVWEENHARGLSLEQMRHPLFAGQCEDCIREMVQNHFNHPSIIIWGILNECASNTTEGREMYRTQFAQIRAMDTSRPLTTACCHHLEELCHDLCDIVSLNIYSKWYSENKVDEFYHLNLKYAEATGGAGKPIILSEFGAAALYGFRDPARVKWSEERQADILDTSLEFYLGREEIKGTYIWQFCDCRVTEENGWFKTRPRTHNNKGVVDDYRRPKLSFETVKKHYRKATAG